MVFKRICELDFQLNSLYINIFLVIKFFYINLLNIPELTYYIPNQYKAFQVLILVQHKFDDC